MAKSSNHTYDIQKWVNLSTFGKILALGYKSCFTEADARGEGVGSTWTTADKGAQKLAKFCGRLLWIDPYGTSKFAFDRTQIKIYASYIYIYNFCIEVFEKTINHTEMIDPSFERKFYGACYRLYKNVVRELNYA